MEGKWASIKDLEALKFRRLTGVKRTTFDKMIEVLRPAEANKGKYRGGRPPKLSLEDRLLMTLEYLREYRTYLKLWSE